MGLDGVELIMAWEEAFGVEFSDEDASRIVTPRDAIELIASRVTVTEDAPCLEQRAFYVLRAALRELSSAERRRIRPFTPLSHLWPLAPPDAVAVRLGGRLGLKDAIPLSRLSTVGELSIWLAENAAETLKQDGAWSREQIARVVKRITLAHLGDVAYGEDQRFVEDLGVD